MVYISSWKKKRAYYAFKIFNYIQKTLSPPCFSLSSATRWKKGRGSETDRQWGGEKGGGVWRDGLVLRTEHRCLGQWKTVTFQLAGVHEEDLIICHIIQQRSTSGQTAQSRQSLLRASPDCSCAKTGTFTLIPFSLHDWYFNVSIGW